MFTKQEYLEEYKNNNKTKLNRNKPKILKNIKKYWKYIITSQKEFKD